MNIAVYLGSTEGEGTAYVNCAEEIGKMIGSGGHTLVYGGSSSGTMGVLADAVLSSGGKVIGVIPEFFLYRVQPGMSECITVKTMSERKKKMIDLADGFVVLPGGPGTLEEMAEVMSAIRLGLIKKPCVIYNLNGYYDILLDMYRQMLAQGFLSLKEYSQYEESFAKTAEEVRAALGLEEL